MSACGVGQLASPWDALLHVAPLRMTQRADDCGTEARAGTKLAGLLAELAACGTATTLSLAVRCELTPRQVWGLLKAPRQVGQVRFCDGMWGMVHGFAGRDVERAAALLRDCGWRVEPPNDKGKRTPEARSAVGGPLDPPVVPL